MKAPTADPRVVAKKAKHLNPWVAWPVMLLALTFGWHYYCLPSKGATAGQFVVESVNPFTNAVVIRGAASNNMERLGHRLGASVAEQELRRHARENFDVWGMLIGYSIRVES